jgi:cytosine permease
MEVELMESNENGQFPQDEAYEYAFEKVPAHKRKRLLSLTVVLAGYPIALSNFVIGGAVGVGLSFSKTILALLVGNAMLIAVVILTGILSYKTGLSTTFLSRRAFGKSGSYIFSFLIVVSAITWVSLNGDIFSRLIDSTFQWWPIPIPITAVVVIFIWMLSAVKGYKGLAFISWIGVPAAIVLAAYGVYAVGVSTNGFNGVLSYVPDSPITFTAATASIVGGWIFGATITPDVCHTRCVPLRKKEITCTSSWNNGFCYWLLWFSIGRRFSCNQHRGR